MAWVGESGSRRVILTFLATLIGGELILRVDPPSNPRTAVSSLHGIRSILLDAADDPREKVIAVGDSTLAGGGVYDHHATVMGRLTRAVSPERGVYNLAVPGGDTTTSLLVLDAAKQVGIRRIDRVIIEVLPSKFLTSDKSSATPADRANESVNSLQRFVPFVQPRQFGLAAESMTYQTRVEVSLQWYLGRLSLLYRHRDYFRTEYLGNYPSFWAVGVAVPRSLLVRLFPAKAQGTNRLGARTNDADYDPVLAPTSKGGPVFFTAHTQGDYLEDAIRVAKDVSQKPPIILVFPMHYEYSRIGSEEREHYRTAFAHMEMYLKRLAAQTGSILVIVPSEEFQDPALWTMTSAHFNAGGPELIWKFLRPCVCQCFPCRPN